MLLRSLTAIVDPRLVTASPAAVTPAATNAAMLSVVPAHTRQVRGKPVLLATAGVIGDMTDDGARTWQGKIAANSCSIRTEIAEALPATIVASSTTSLHFMEHDALHGQLLHCRLLELCQVTTAATCGHPTSHKIKTWSL